jgi:predicted restriction endonuclease
MDTLMKYVDTFASLRRERSRGVWSERTAGGAPHKPLLLLSILDLFASGEIRTSFIELSSALEERFANYWVLVTGRSYNGDLVHPFFALKNERVKFWSLVPRRGKEELLINKPDWVRLDLDHLRQVTLGARIDPALSKLLLVPEYRTSLRQTLIERYFAASTILELAGFTADVSPEYPPALRRQSTLNRLLRDSAEAKSLKRLYDYTCQVCQIRLAVGEQPYAEAAHIRPLGKPHDGPDSKDNLLCLCPNHHVLLDLGAFSISDKLILIPDGLQLSIHSTHRISVAHLKYHREQIFGSPTKLMLASGR